jgi:hypothetical protein
MSVLGGVLKIQNLCARRPELTIGTAKHLLRNGSVIDSSFDFEHAEQFLIFAQLNHGDLPPDRYAAMRLLIRRAIEACRPPWVTAIPYGRTQVLRFITKDEEQCFASAGLLDAHPSDEIARWWDELAGLIRTRQDDEKAKTGRQAEALTIAHERQRLKAAGLDIEPVWVALDDNSLGYDVRSYETDASLRYIEVKGCQTRDLVIYITRNEWRQAQQLGARYFFHIWDLSTQTLYELSPNQLSPHIPLEQGRGQWQAVRIAVEALRSA